MEKFLLIILTLSIISCSKDTDTPVEEVPPPSVVNIEFQNDFYSIGDSLYMDIVLMDFQNNGNINLPGIKEAILYINENERERIALNLHPKEVAEDIALPFKNQLIDGMVKAADKEADIVTIKIVLVSTNQINRTFLFAIKPVPKTEG